MKNMPIEVLSTTNLTAFTELVLELWPDCEFDEEYPYYQSLIGSENEICYLFREQENYLAFIHISLRTDYVEGATDFPVAYIEGVYVRPEYQKRGIANQLVNAGAEWGRQKGCKQFASDAELNNEMSIDFHKKIGFSEVNRIVCFIKDL
jgi:aminoglycoside 6'-N-acetyltransferase I